MRLPGALVYLSLVMIASGCYYDSDTNVRLLARALNSNGSGMVKYELMEDSKPRCPKLPRRALNTIVS